ncbi:MAG: hypothetical protein RSE41_00375 [Clostridia bacterium]
MIEKMEKRNKTYMLNIYRNAVIKPNVDKILDLIEKDASNGYLYGKYEISPSQAVKLKKLGFKVEMLDNETYLIH